LCHHRHDAAFVGALFEYEDIGSVALKGFSGGQAWRVLSEGRVESRFEALRGSAAVLTPLVGREEGWTCCCGAGGRRKRARAASCCCRAARHWQVRFVASLPQHLGASPASASNISVRRTIRTAPSTVVGHLKRAAGSSTTTAPRTSYSCGVSFTLTALNR
jgi:hypothetical protein